MGPGMRRICAVLADLCNIDALVGGGRVEQNVDAHAAQSLNAGPASRGTWRPSWGQTMRGSLRDRMFLVGWSLARAVVPRGAWPIGDFCLPDHGNPLWLAGLWCAGAGRVSMARPEIGHLLVSAR